MAHGPEIGAVGVGQGVIRIDLDGLVEIGFRLGEAAPDRAGPAALRIGRGKRPAAGGAGIDHGGAACYWIVPRGLSATPGWPLPKQLCHLPRKAEPRP